MENQAMPVQKRKFLCLEDRFLQALYKENDGIALQHLAENILISENAALSILHRIKNTFPQYIQVKENPNASGIWLAPHSHEKNQVDTFLMEGGYAKMNEDEFLRYYEKELKKQKWELRIQTIKSNVIKRKWQLSAVLLTGGGLLLATYFHLKKS